MKWALNTYQICQDWELNQILEMARLTGYHGVEFLMDTKQKHGFEWYTPRAEWEKIRSQVNNSGVSVLSLATRQNFQHEDSGNRGERIRRVKRIVDMAEFMGCHHVSILGDRSSYKIKKKVIGYVIDILKEFGDYIEPKNITMSIEMVGDFTNIDPIMSVIKGVNRPNIGLVFNPQAIRFQEENLESLFSVIAPYITAVHASCVEIPEMFKYYQEMFKYLNQANFSGIISNRGGYMGSDPEKVLQLYVTLFKAFS